MTVDSCMLESFLRILNSLKEGDTYIKGVRVRVRLGVRLGVRVRGG